MNHKLYGPFSFGQNTSQFEGPCALFFKVQISLDSGHLNVFLSLFVLSSPQRYFYDSELSLVMASDKEES